VTTEPVDPMTAAPGSHRASDADREQVIDVLKVAFAQGRLTKDELDLRAGQALTSRTYAELAVATGDFVAAKPVREWAPRETPSVRKTRPRRNPVRGRDGSPASQMALKWGFGLATIVLPAMIAATFHTKNQNLFCGTVLLLIAYFLVLPVVMANSAAAKFENES
jgi:Domain of unknown function (DUF1707)